MPLMSKIFSNFLVGAVLAVGLHACTDPVAPPAACEERLTLANTPAWTGTCANAQVDWEDARCLDSGWTLPACGTTTTFDGGFFGEQHIPLPMAITYVDSPPTSGPHRGEWPNWGEYGFLPKQRWLHALEHGGLVILYHPCVPASVVDALRSWAQSVPADATGPFRWLLTPYPNLDSAFALVTWQHRLSGNCFDEATASGFRQAHYRQAPEDEPADGGYSCTWMGRDCGKVSGSGTADVTVGSMGDSR